MSPGRSVKEKKRMNFQPLEGKVAVNVQNLVMEQQDKGKDARGTAVMEPRANGKPSLAVWKKQSAMQGLPRSMNAAVIFLKR